MCLPPASCTQCATPRDESSQTVRVDEGNGPGTTGTILSLICRIELEPPSADERLCLDVRSGDANEGENDDRHRSRRDGAEGEREPRSRSARRLALETRAYARELALDLPVGNLEARRFGCLLEHRDERRDVALRPFPAVQRAREPRGERLFLTPGHVHLPALAASGACRAERSISIWQEPTLLPVSRATSANE